MMDERTMMHDKLADTDPHRLMYHSKNSIERWIANTRRKTILTLVVEIMGFNKGNILDAGCGDGFFVQTLIQEDVYGLDISKKRLERARDKNKNCKFSIADLCDGLPFKDESFDVIIFTEVIEHLENPNVKELLRVLKTKGHIIVSTPNEYLWRLGRLLLLRFPLKISDHYQSWTPKKLNQAFRSKPISSCYIPNLFYPLCMVHIHVYQKSHNELHNCP